MSGILDKYKYLLDGFKKDIGEYIKCYPSDYDFDKILKSKDEVQFDLEKIQNVPIRKIGFLDGDWDLSLLLLLYLYPHLSESDQDLINDFRYNQKKNKYESSVLVEYSVLLNNAYYSIHISGDEPHHVLSNVPAFSSEESYTRKY